MAGYETACDSWRCLCTLCQADWSIKGKDPKSQSCDPWPDARYRQKPSTRCCVGPHGTSAHPSAMQRQRGTPSRISATPSAGAC